MAFFPTPFASLPVEPIPDKQQADPVPSLGRQYGLALGCTIAAGLIRLAFHPWLEGRVPFLLFLPATLFSAWYGGLGPGLLSILLGLIEGQVLMQSHYPWQSYGLDNFLAVLVYLLSAAMIVGLADAERKSRQRAAFHAHQALLEHERLGVTLRSLGDAVLATDEAGKVAFMNPVAERLTGWKQEEAAGKASEEVFKIVNEHSRQIVESPIEKVLRENTVADLANHTLLLTRDGREVAIDDSGAPIRDEAGRVSGAVLVFRDVTERKRHQREIEVLNARLQRAMQETHHRVKNNLQVIASMIDMLTEDHPQGVSIQQIKEIGEQILSLAVIHDLLTQKAKAGEDVEHISTRQAMENLLPVLERVVGEKRLRFEVEEVVVSVKQAISLSVLVNEMVSNAVKHGEGPIDLTFAVVKGQGCLSVEDRGPGFPEGFDPGVAAHTGLELIESLSRLDLGGQVTYENRSEGGARVRVEYPLVVPGNTSCSPV